MPKDQPDSGRRLVDDLLRESEERYRAFIANSSEGIWRFELEEPVSISLPTDQQIDACYERGYLAECNNAMARMYGFEGPEEIVGARLGDLLGRSDPNNVAYLKAFIQAGYRIVNAESSELDKEGRQVYFANNLIGIIENGFLYRAWGTQRDITERKRTEQRVGLLYGITRILAEKGPTHSAAPDILKLIGETLEWELGAIWRVDEEGGHLRCLEVWHQPLVNVAEFEAVNRRVTFARGEGLPGTVWQRGRALWIDDFSQEFSFPRAHLAAREGIRAAVCFPLLLHSEIVGVMEFFSHEIRQPDDQLLKLMDAIVSQVAQLVEHGRVEQARSESEERFRSLAETASDGMITVDESSKIIFVNPAAGRIFGYEPDEMMGQSLTMLMPDYLRHLHRSGMKRHLETGQRHISWDGIELPGLHKSGAEVPLEISFGASHREGKHFFTGIVRDISERKRADALLRESLKNEQEARLKAEEASRLKDEFLATVSHELRTPLTAVVGWAHMLLTEQLDEQGANDALEAIVRNARSQTQLIDDLLDVSRIITGRLRLDVQTIDPAASIDDAIEAVRPAADAKGVILHKISADGVGLIAADTQRLQQILWNLLSNAIKFTPRDGRVEVKLERDSASIVICVSDNGDGIRPEFLPYVFDRFRQADMSTTRHHGGLGLGLSIVRHLTELHGGTVHAESEGEGRGCSFTVKLPVVAVYHKDHVEDEDLTAETTVASLDGFERLDNLKVLVVDDEVETVELLKAILERCGAEVVVANSAAEALGLLEQTKLDIVVSDIEMPAEDGYVLIQKIRALAPERGGRVPAVALTAYSGPEDRVRTLRAGYQMHIPKPVEGAEFVAIISSLAARSSA